MLHVAQSLGQPSSDAVLRTMFAARKAVFVDLLKWKVPVIEDRWEVDQFDDVHATYIVLADRQGHHLGSARLLPTLRPHILDSFYTSLCEDAVPRAPDVFEISRFCLDRALGAGERRIVRDTLVTALVDHALAHGISAYTAIAEIGWFQQILAFGWRCSPLGLPQRLDGRLLGALRIEIDADTSARLARSGVVPVAELPSVHRAAA